MKTARKAILVLLVLGGIRPATAQISPGPLAAVHSRYEGLSNCTLCHSLGDQVTNAKCLACHTDLKARIDQNQGYHVSAEVKGKNCTTCHSDHHGLTFQIVRFNKATFNHANTGFRLLGTHAKQECSACHKPEFIADRSIRAKKSTYLGLNTACLTCHTDYHQKTLSSDCGSCHNNEVFRPAPGFSHTRTQFPLVGMHQAVPCVKCHPVTTLNGASFQRFAGIEFASCTNCHADVHQGQFGQDCRKCHSEQSFHTIKGMSNFDHSKTAFPLVDKHQGVPCKSCHKGNLTDPLPHSRCTDCHSDYHHGQLMAQDKPRDCSECHSTKGFTESSFTIERHNMGPFALQGAHLATPCFTCHKKQDLWNFRGIGLRCNDCHQDVHQSFIDPKYYPDKSCQVCHNPEAWTEVTFDHSVTGFPLSAVHATQTCRACHFKVSPDGKELQQFSTLTSNCTQCHQDKHFGQFDVNGTTDCLKCHTLEAWKIAFFDHNKTAFKLDGQHQMVPCAKCHKNVTSGGQSYVLYKIGDTRCEHCH